MRLGKLVANFVHHPFFVITDLFLWFCLMIHFVHLVITALMALGLLFNIHVLLERSVISQDYLHHLSVFLVYQGTFVQRVAWWNPMDLAMLAIFVMVALTHQHLSILHVPLATIVLMVVTILYLVLWELSLQIFLTGGKKIVCFVVLVTIVLERVLSMPQICHVQMDMYVLEELSLPLQLTVLLATHALLDISVQMHPS
jgi:hypothetical protein